MKQTCKWLFRATKFGVMPQSRLLYRDVRAANCISERLILGAKECGVLPPAYRDGIQLLGSKLCLRDRRLQRLGKPLANLAGLLVWRPCGDDGAEPNTDFIILVTGFSQGRHVGECRQARL